MGMNGNFYSSGNATLKASPWSGMAYFKHFAMEGNIAGYTPAIFDLLVKTAAGLFKKFDGDDIFVADESLTLVAGTKQLANVVNTVVKKVTNDAGTVTYVEGTDYTFDKNGNVTYIAAGSIGATDTIKVTYFFDVESFKIVGVLETFNSTTYDNTVLTELVQGDLDLSLVNKSNATNAYVLEHITKELKALNINVQ